MRGFVAICLVAGGAVPDVQLLSEWRFRNRGEGAIAFFENNPVQSIFSYMKISPSSAMTSRLPVEANCLYLFAR